MPPLLSTDLLKEVSCFNYFSLPFIQISSNWLESKENKGKKV